MSIIITVANQKGGVGKSSITFNLAKELSNSGKNVLLVDNDPQGNLTSVFIDNPENIEANIINIYKNDDYDVHPQKVAERLYLIGADIRLSSVVQTDINFIYRLKETLERIKRKYDFILIDCLPSFGQIMTSAFNAANYVLIPTKLSPFDTYGLNDLFATIANIKKRINHHLEVMGIVFNMVEGKSTALGEKIESSIRMNYGDKVFNAKIPKGVKFEESSLFNKSIIEYAPSSKIAAEFKSFYNEFLSRLEGHAHEKK